MIITEIKLNPFAGLSKQTLRFEKGLNVILGANETGKSTFAKALQNVLFGNVNLTDYQFKRRMGSFLPLGGGDTIKVGLKFLHSGREYALNKSWGATKSAELVLPNKTVVTDEESIAKEIQSILGVTEGTYTNVLMTHQAQLANTLRNLLQSTETLQTLGDILSIAVLETDGVSVEKLKDRINEIYNQYFDHWDKTENYPEKGRGVENPWKVKIGLILAAFYRFETLKKRYKEACGYETALDKINQRISTVVRSLAERQAFAKRNEAIVNDVKQRQLLSTKLEVLYTKVEVYKKVNDQWPVIENELYKLEKSLPKLKQRESELKDEEKTAKIADDNRKLLEKHQRVSQKKQKLDEAKQQLRSVQKLTKEDLKEIRDFTFSIDTLKASLEAGQIKLHLKAKTQLEISFKKDFDDTKKKQLKSGESLGIEAGGLIELGHPDWELYLRSGKGNFDSLAAELTEKQKALKGLTKKHKVENVQDAEVVNQQYQARLNDEQAAREALQSELGDESYEEFKKRVKQLVPVERARPLAEIVGELKTLQNQIQRSEEKVQEYSKKLDEFKQQYEKKDKLLLNLAEAIGAKGDHETKMKDLKPLPKGFKDSEEYIERYDRCLQELGEMKEKHNNLLLERADLERQMPEESAEELRKQVTEAKEEFEAVKKKSDAISRIHHAIFDLAEVLSSNCYKDFTKSVEGHVSSITLGKYAQIRMSEGLPDGFVREDGQLLSCELLSTGTLVALALSLRLAMSDYFLADRDGFLVMDDPLVDMDPARQAAAAKDIREYSQRKQLLVCTCQPTNAEILGGNLISL